MSWLGHFWLKLVKFNRVLLRIVGLWSSMNFHQRFPTDLLEIILCGIIHFKDRELAAAFHGIIADTCSRGDAQRLHRRSLPFYRPIIPTVLANHTNKVRDDISGKDPFPKLTR